MCFVSCTVISNSAGCTSCLCSSCVLLMLLMLIYDMCMFLSVLFGLLPYVDLCVALRGYERVVCVGVM